MNADTFTYRDTTSNTKADAGQRALRLDEVRVCVEPDDTTIGQEDYDGVCAELRRLADELPDGWVMDKRTGEVMDKYDDWDTEEDGEREQPAPELVQQIEKEHGEKEKYESGYYGYVGVFAKATVSYPIGGTSRRLEFLQSGGLWGVQTTGGREDAAYLDEVARDEIKDLVDHLRAFNVQTMIEGLEVTDKEYVLSLASLETVEGQLDAAFKEVKE